MTQPQPQPILIRIATPQDAEACGTICFNAFNSISSAHGFPCDLPGPGAATGLLKMMFSHPGFYCLVAESMGNLAGSNCLDERSIIAGIGPITVEPATQNRGVGRMLMQAVIDRAKERGAAGLRLVQAAFHSRSLSLYANLGFVVREPLSCMQGKTRQRTVPGCTVRKAEEADVPVCNLLSRQVHGFDRGGEMRDAVDHGTAVVVERDGRVTGYASSLAFSGHATAETNLDLQALISSADGFGGPGILVPIRNAALFQWCLANDLRVVQPMTLMSLGLYNEPAGSWLPSIMF